MPLNPTTYTGPAANLGRFGQVENGDTLFLTDEEWLSCYATGNFTLQEATRNNAGILEAWDTDRWVVAGGSGEPGEDGASPGFEFVRIANSTYPDDGEFSLVDDGPPYPLLVGSDDEDVVDWFGQFVAGDTICIAFTGGDWVATIDHVDTPGNRAEIHFTDNVGSLPEIGQVGSITRGVKGNPGESGLDESGNLALASGKAVNFANGSSVLEIPPVGENPSVGLRLLCSAGIALDWQVGRLILRNQSGQAIRVLVSDGTTPGVNDDATNLGATTETIFESAGVRWKCSDATPGAAVWRDLRGSDDIHWITSLPSMGISEVRLNGKYPALAYTENTGHTEMTVLRLLGDFPVLTYLNIGNHGLNPAAQADLVADVLRNAIAFPGSGTLVITNDTAGPLDINNPTVADNLLQLATLSWNVTYSSVAALQGLSKTIIGELDPENAPGIISYEVSWSQFGAYTYEGRFSIGGGAWGTPSSVSTPYQSDHPTGSSLDFQVRPVWVGYPGEWTHISIL